MINGNKNIKSRDSLGLPAIAKPSKYSKNLIDLVAQCLRKDVHRRPSAADLLSHPLFCNRPKHDLNKALKGYLTKIAKQAEKASFTAGGGSVIIARRAAGSPAREFEVAALNAYKAREKGGLSFNKGDLIMVTEVDDDGGRYKGRLGKKTGWFPSYYVRATGMDSSFHVTC